MTALPINHTPPMASIGIPIVCEESFIDQKITSVLKQSYRFIEIIISDNYSIGLVVSL